jgi:hypothetical protein
MERRRLDSLVTFALKFILPVFWAVSLGRAYLAMKAQDTPPGIGFAVFSLVTLAFFLRQTFGLKKVYMDERRLYVSDYLQEVSVPLETIERVTQFPMTNSPVTIHFRKDTDFGKRIRFFPGGQLINTFRRHPVVSQLREAAESATSHP